VITKQGPQLASPEGTPCRAARSCRRENAGPGRRDARSAGLCLDYPLGTGVPQAPQN
jgi:hypothetical protein